MIFVRFKCLDKCKKTFSLGVESPSGLDFEGFNGVYSCPVCKGWQIKQLNAPVDIELPKIRIRRSTYPTNIPSFRSMDRPTASLATESEPEVVSVGQLHSGGRGDHQYGEGASEESEQPIIDGIVVPRAGPPRTDKWTNTKAQYEAEECKALGVPS